MYNLTYLYINNVQQLLYIAIDRIIIINYVLDTIMNLTSYFVLIHYYNYGKLL